MLVTGPFRPNPAPAQHLNATTTSVTKMLGAAWRVRHRALRIVPYQYSSNPAWADNLRRLANEVAEFGALVEDAAARVRGMVEALSATPGTRPAAHLGAVAAAEKCWATVTRVVGRGTPDAGAFAALAPLIAEEAAGWSGGWEQMVYAVWAENAVLAAELAAEECRRASEHAERFAVAPTGRPPKWTVYHPVQVDILTALKGTSKGRKELARLVGVGESQLTRDYLNPLKASGQLAHKRGVGYYRPDSPPAA